MPRIIAINRFYWPSEVATSQILSDLAEGLADAGVDVEVVAGRGSSPSSANVLSRIERRRGVTIRRVWTTNCGRRWLWGRAVDYLAFYLSASLLLLSRARRGDILLVKSDPPLMVVAAGLVARIRRASMIAWHQDLFPEAAEAVHVVRKGGVLSRTARWLRNRAIVRADANVAISPAMAEKLAALGARRENVSVIPNWCAPDLGPVPAADNALRREWAPSGTVVIGYSGNLGRVHQAERVAELIRSTRDLPDITWLFIGGGVGSPWIEAVRREIGAERILVQPSQPRARLSESLSVPDIHLISLDPACEGLVMPSKLYGVMAVGRPVLNFGSPTGSVAREVFRHQIGITIDSGRPETWHDTFRAFVERPEELERMGQRARVVHQQRYLPRLRVQQWHQLLMRSGPAPSRAADGGAAVKEAY